MSCRLPQRSMALRRVKSLSRPRLPRRTPGRTACPQRATARACASRCSWKSRPEFFLIWLGANKLGLPVVPINPDLRAAELEYLIGHAEPALIITTEARAPGLQAAADAAGVDCRAITLDADLPSPRAGAVVARDTVGAAREAAVLYTSGTTGNPKGCVLANEYFLEVGRWYSTLGGLVSLTTEGERMITPLPVFHMNAIAYSFMAMMTVGGCLTVLDRFHPSTWWQDVADNRRRRGDLGPSARPADRPVGAGPGAGLAGGEAGG